MRLVATAKDLGNTSSIWPKDCDDIDDLPVDLSVAIDQALKILSWQENLASDEMPPQWMWPLDWEINDWFIKVKNDRDKKYGNSNSSSIPDDYSDWEENEHSARFR